MMELTEKIRLKAGVGAGGDEFSEADDAPIELD